MKSFSEYLNEAKNILLYHGDNFKSTKLDPKLMNNGNNQEGIGIYFGDLKTAKTYGKDIVSVELDKSKFINSRNTIDQEISLPKILKIITHLHKKDKEAMFFLMSDYVYITDMSEINSSNLKEFTGFMMNEEVRNFQITMAETFGVVNFVDIWNKTLPNIHGTYEKISGFYCVINNKLKINKIDNKG